MAHDFEAGVLFKLPVVREIALGMGCCELSNPYVDSGQRWIVAGLPVRTDVLLTDCPSQIHCPGGFSGFLKLSDLGVPEYSPRGLDSP